MLSLSYLLLLAPTLSYALLVAPSSPCAVQCGNTLTTTSGPEITCDDGEYGYSTYGATFQSCIACELGSTFYDSGTNFSDFQAALYNLRFALSWCLWGFDNNTNTEDIPCLTYYSCAPLQDMFEFDNLALNSTNYDYCSVLDQNEISEPRCSACLSETGSDSYLSNFVTVLSGACDQKPDPGVTLSFQGSPFSTIPLNITIPTPKGLSYYKGVSDGLSLGAKVGISVGCVLAALATAGFCIVWNGKRRRRRVLNEKARQRGYEWDAAQHGLAAKDGTSTGEGTPAGFFDSPQSQRPFANAWGYPQDVKSAMSESPITPVVGQGSRLSELSRDRNGLSQDNGDEMSNVGGVRGINHPPPMLQPSGMR